MIRTVLPIDVNDLFQLEVNLRDYCICDYTKTAAVEYASLTTGVVDESRKSELLTCIDLKYKLKLENRVADELRHLLSYICVGKSLVAKSSDPLLVEMIELVNRLVQQRFQGFQPEERNASVALQSIKLQSDRLSEKYRSILLPHIPLMEQEARACFVRSGSLSIDLNVSCPERKFPVTLSLHKYRILDLRDGPNYLELVEEACAEKCEYLSSLDVIKDLCESLIRPPAPKSTIEEFAAIARGRGLSATWISDRVKHLAS
ncbi:MAG: hypothetical protein MRY21_08110 [Simkaniaceae bacterium]|nr:hypothetical protein [Simkaniaceae bacterium]